MVNNSVINCGLRPYPWTAHHPPIVCGGFFCCVRAFFWIDYRIIEFIGHLSFCQKRDFYDGILKKNGAWFFFSIFCGGTRKKKYIFYKTKQKKKKKRKKKKRKKKKVVIGIWSHSLIVRLSSVLPMCAHTLSC